MKTPQKINNSNAPYLTNYLLFVCLEMFVILFYDVREV